METMHIGDYNAFVSSFGGTTIDLAEDEYAILCNYGEMEPRYNAGLEISLIGVISRETILREYIEQVREFYDYIIIDCMPSLGMLTINALASGS